MSSWLLMLATAPSFSMDRGCLGSLKDCSEVIPRREAVEVKVSDMPKPLILTAVIESEVATEMVTEVKCVEEGDTITCGW
jgi:hypothetical protein